MLIVSGSERVEREREARFGPMSSRAWRKLEFKLLRSFICEEYLCIRTKTISKLSEVQTRGGGGESYSARIMSKKKYNCFPTRPHMCKAETIKPG